MVLSHNPNLVSNNYENLNLKNPQLKLGLQNCTCGLCKILQSLTP